MHYEGVLQKEEPESWLALGGESSTSVANL